MVAVSNYGGTPALELFRPSDIGDPDGDGLLEFVDAWGQAIQWIRWPAGYPSDLNRYANDDAMDPLRTDWRYQPGVVGYDGTNTPQTIVPLIVSSGADERFGVNFEFNSQPLIYARMRQGTGDNQVYVDPFFTWDFVNNGANGPSSVPPYPSNHPAGYRSNQLGSIFDESLATDDITNHDLILEP